MQTTHARSLACLPLEFPLNCCSFTPTPLTNLITVTKEFTIKQFAKWCEGNRPDPMVRRLQLLSTCHPMSVYILWVCVFAVCGQTDAGVCTSCLSWPVLAHTNQMHTHTRTHTYRQTMNATGKVITQSCVSLWSPLYFLIYSLFVWEIMRTSLEIHESGPNSSLWMWEALWFIA